MEAYFDLSNFETFPIEFKEINPEDFTVTFNIDGTTETRADFEIENGGNKVLLEPDENGYINDSFQSNIIIDHKNTVVVNAPVGQGKSHAIIQTVKRYYDSPERYMVFVASPFVSLVKQYHNDLINAGIPESQIFNYNSLGRTSGTEYLDKSIQVITVNTLLGNPGEDGFKNSDVKREYLDKLVKYCERNRIKVVFIYDEIHDSYTNFKQKYIFNLWKWRNVIHKNFVLSATYNEASKVVIEYLAELTDHKIKILESPRIRRPDKQSSLFLHYSPAYHFTPKTKEIKSVITSLLNRDKNIDILSYSRNLAKSILDPKGELGGLLITKYGEINDCTSELISNQREENEEPENQFDNSKCNVGTNFKTGVSITKDNHAFVIILPPRNTRLAFRNKYGIFSGGINSVIQALARQRRVGEIHIILPKPDQFDFDTLVHADMSTEQKNDFEIHYQQLQFHKSPDKLVKYIKLNRQDYFLKQFYENKLKGNVIDEINAVARLRRSDTLPILEFPTYKEFKLEEGEDYLANEYPIFGEDISAYTTYAAIANQFINCKLEQINHSMVIQFDEGGVQDMLYSVFENFFGEDYFYSLRQHTTFPMFYTDFRKQLHQDFNLKFRKAGGTEYETITDGSTIGKKFEIQLLIFLHKLWNYQLSSERDDYSRSDYFHDNIASALTIDLDSVDTLNHRQRVEFYKILDFFRCKLINSIEDYDRRGSKYVYIPSENYEGFFTESDKEKFFRMIELSNSDPQIKQGVFDFKRRFEDNTTTKGKLKTFYRMLKEDFIEVENKENDPKIVVRGKRRNVKPVLSVRLISNSPNNINNLEVAEYINLPEEVNVHFRAE